MNSYEEKNLNNKIIWATTYYSNVCIIPPNLIQRSKRFEED